MVSVIHHAAHPSDSQLGTLADVPNIRMLVPCQCHLGELLSKNLHHLLSELEVLLVNFDGVAFSFS